MATLVLSTVGTALGGPLGAAVGSLLGQAIDNRLFAPSARHGPRLGDLSIQTSSYGTPMPRIYGQMRVAGTVVWATPLKENRSVRSQGKGRPEVISYSYTASFAVALSSRRAIGVGRIWADGKLLRGDAGDFKVRTGFRFHPGSEDQPLDPLIAAAEGIANTPAYRGTALAVFEDLELAEFGNRIPVLTFEVIADPAGPTVSAVLADCTDGVIDADSTASVVGYAAHGGSIRAAVAPLVDSFALPIFDTGERLETPVASAVNAVAQADLGCTTNGDARLGAFERSQSAASDLPAALNLTYYDQARDYQQGSSRARSGGAGPETTSELPAVLQADQAKALAELALSRRLLARNRVTVRLPPTYFDVAPGTRLTVSGLQGEWIVGRSSVEGLVTILELTQQPGSAQLLPASPGRALPDADIVATPTVLELFDLPQLTDNATGAALHLAAASAGASWRRVPIEIDAGGSVAAAMSAPFETVLGYATTSLAPGSSELIDAKNSLDVTLVDQAHWLTSCTDPDLFNGTNVAVLGDEIIQFGQATPIGQGQFRLSRLLRGRRGTEWAMAGHSPGEPFALIASDSLERVEIAPESVGTSVTVTAFGLADGDGAEASRVAAGEALRPPSPVHVRAAAAGGGLVIQWVRRSRAGWAWVDGVDAPLGESLESYRVTLTGSASTAQHEVAEPLVALDAAQLTALGAGALTVTIVQAGDRAVSRPASTTLTLP